jgi:hypothetical protein
MPGTALKNQSARLHHDQHNLIAVVQIRKDELGHRNCIVINLEL